MRYLITLIILLSIFTSAKSQKQETEERPKIGLVLSGGGAKGLAHVGILKAIDEAGLHIDYITGTSMGAIIAAIDRLIGGFTIVWVLDLICMLLNKKICRFLFII